MTPILNPKTQFGPSSDPIRRSASGDLWTLKSLQSKGCRQVAGFHGAAPKPKFRKCSFGSDMDLEAGNLS